ncbi:hypothetical protein E4T66_18240 [Sinimarinibacterium sp. CAU 1509]|uniref:hypothetical protein n=1 Tax=Sinimarinibacterium sp. CAU 1509 TaxID=2562283 RepID=UPI0010AD0993|nr:hypothetical protein [Sinimarinibacterium sp. CAU 1509]TJY57346.1 hypothetical protein E4T66_18240 [Sinimarinibacterium sp. CAU 1509]
MLLFITLSVCAVVGAATSLALRRLREVSERTSQSLKQAGGGQEIKVATRPGFTWVQRGGYVLLGVVVVTAGAEITSTADAPAIYVLSLLCVGAVFASLAKTQANARMTDTLAAVQQHLRLRRWRSGGSDSV